MNTATANYFEELYSIIKRLRDPNGGCPWDIEQTPMTLRSTLLEETYETLDAIEETAHNPAASAHAAEELGDVLLNVTMLAYMYEQQKYFSIADMLEALNRKLIRRHPHVFGKTEGFASPDDSDKPATAEKVLAQWEKIKETVEGRAADSILDGIPKQFPPLTRAYKLQKKAAKKGFDWQSIDEMQYKIDEELAEFRCAIAESQAAHIEEEFGDLLFTLVNAARHLHIDPAVALNRANAKFERRFRFVEKKMNKAGMTLSRETAAQMNIFWDEAKNNES